MDFNELTAFSVNLAELAETLSFALPVAAGIAGFLGLGSLVFFSFVRQH